MTRDQFRRDFKQSFPGLDFTIKHTFAGSWYFKDQQTHWAWLGYISAFENYSKDNLTGEYSDA